jgi:phosphoribosylformylglycinamidine cyclo-ligase
VSYQDAGVDLRAAENLTARLADLVESTRTEGVRASFGSFGGRFAVAGDTELVASADGVGTKVMVAARFGRHDTVGEDLVNHCVNDVLVEGAVPLFFLDYFACGTLAPDIGYVVVSGVARGCRRNGCALLGGETAEMPGVYRPGEYDLAGFLVGRRIFKLPPSDQLAEGDVLIGLSASGFHTNGYSLLRQLLFDRLGLGPDDPMPGTGRSVSDVLLTVHRSYLSHLRGGLEMGQVRAAAHITGGGLQGNLRRVLPPHLDAEVDVTSWTPGPEFRFVAEQAGLDQAALYETLNMGIGMVVVARSQDADSLIAAVTDTGCEAFRCGHLAAGAGSVRLEGSW